MFNLNRQELTVFIVSGLYIALFLIVALSGKNSEFVLYGLVVAACLFLVAWKQHKVKYPMRVLWGLSVWGLLHMAGGNLYIGETKLYDLTLVPIVAEPYGILGYDQVVHFFGFGAATWLCAHLLNCYLPQPVSAYTKGRLTLIGLVVLMGLGVGGINEILEFFAVVTMPETGVGGYENTMLDMVFNLSGAIAAALFLPICDRPKSA